MVRFAQVKGETAQRAEDTEQNVPPAKLLLSRQSLFQRLADSYNASRTGLPFCG